MEKPLIFRNMTKLFRLLEISLALLLLPWLWSQLFFLTKLATFSAAFVRHIVALAVSPISIFILFNSILIALFVKSGQLSDGLNSEDNNQFDPYDDLIDDDFTYFENFRPVLEPEEIVYQDKEMIDVAGELKEGLIRESEAEAETDTETEKILRRAETEENGEVAAEELSSEEFKRTVEDFIAKQMRFHQEEKMAIVAC